MKKLLIVVDYQNDFIDSKGSLYLNKGEEIYDDILRIIRNYQKDNSDIIFLKDTHYDNYMETEEGKNLPIPHTKKDTWGHQLYGELENISKKYIVYEKNTFGSDKLGLYLNEHHYDEIALIGVLTNMCVVANCFIAKAFNPDAHFKVYKKAVSSGNPESDALTFTLLKTNHFEIVE